MQLHNEQAMYNMLPRYNCSCDHGRVSRSRHGFTLVEIVVTIVVMGILLTGLTSAIMVATAALPDDDNINAQTIAARDALEHIAVDLHEAQHITESGSERIGFTVADRDGDGTPEHIMYEWSGIAGDPLMRTYNDDDSSAVVENVHFWALSYTRNNVTEIYPGPGVEDSTETLVKKYDINDTERSFQVTNNNWIAQYITPSLPPDALSYRVSRFSYYARSTGDKDGKNLVQVRLPGSSGCPTGTLIDETTLLEGWLDESYQWTHSWFTEDTRLHVNQPVCVLIRQDGYGSPGCSARYNASDEGMAVTFNEGHTWNCSPAASMQYQLHARITRPGPDQEIVRIYTTAIQMTLQTSNSQDSRIETTVNLPNTPEMLDAVWELDFESAPTKVDIDANGIGDWRRRDGNSFDTGTLVQGVWYADCTLDTQPENGFTRPVTAHVRFRCSSYWGNGMVFWINADRQGLVCAPIFAHLQLDFDNTQTLTVYHKIDNSRKVPLVQVGGLPNSYVTLRVLIDPKYDTVNIRIDNKDRGTYVYNRIYVPTKDSFASILPWGSSGEFDSVSIRVGGFSP